MENARIRCTADFKEGVASFLEKRKPVWQSKLGRLIHDMRTIEYHDTTLRVRYAETDQMGVVYHANYLIWFEVGRVELMRALGFDYKIDGDRRRLPHRRRRSPLPLRKSRALRPSASRPHAHRRMAQSRREIFLRNFPRRKFLPARHRLHHARHLRQQRPPQISAAEISRRPAAPECPRTQTGATHDRARTPSSSPATISPSRSSTTSRSTAQKFRSPPTPSSA